MPQRDGKLGHSRKKKWHVKEALSSYTGKKTTDDENRRYCQEDVSSSPWGFMGVTIHLINPVTRVVIRVCSHRFRIFLRKLEEDPPLHPHTHNELRPDCHWLAHIATAPTYTMTFTLCLSFILTTCYSFYSRWIFKFIFYYRLTEYKYRFDSFHNCWIEFW